MTLYTAARGEVVGAPVRVGADTGGMTVLVLRDARPRDLNHPSGLGVEYRVCLQEPDLVRRFSNTSASGTDSWC